MNITQVKINKFDKPPLRGFANITFDECFVVEGLKIMDGRNGLFVAMPSKKNGEKYKDVCFPVTKEFRQHIQDQVLASFNQSEQTTDDGLAF